MNKYVFIFASFLLSSCSYLPTPSMDFFGGGQEVRIINAQDEAVVLRYFDPPPSGSVHAYYVKKLGLEDSFITTKFEAERTYPKEMWFEREYLLGTSTATIFKGGNEYELFFKGEEHAKTMADKMVFSRDEANRFHAEFQGKHVILVNVEDPPYYQCKRQRTYDDKAYCIALESKGVRNGQERSYLTTYYDLEKDKYQNKTIIHNNNIPEARCYEWTQDFYHCKKLRKAKVLVGIPSR